MPATRRLPCRRAGRNRPRIATGDRSAISARSKPRGRGPRRATRESLRNRRMRGWGGRIRTSVWRNQNPLPYRLATPQCAGEPAGADHRGRAPTLQPRSGAERSARRRRPRGFGSDRLEARFRQSMRREMVPPGMRSPHGPICPRPAKRPNAVLPPAHALTIRARLAPCGDGMSECSAVW